MPAPPDDHHRARARALAAAAHRDGAPTRWFEELYAEAARGEAVVPWADRVANPLMVAALGDRDLAGVRTLVVGCGLGDDAVWLAGRGARVTAFDVAPTAVRAAAARFPDTGVTWVAADLLALPAAFAGAFDLVVEISTLQCLPAALRPAALAALVGALAPGGQVLAIARAREPADPPGAMPWPLTRDELTAVAERGCAIERFDDVLDHETPPVRRFVMIARRA